MKKLTLQLNHTVRYMYNKSKHKQKQGTCHKHTNSIALRSRRHIP